jgi:hypothetical protein
MAAFRGSCLCGEVAFEVEGPFDRFLNCHCSRCRKATGTAHSCEVIVNAPALRWLRGEQSVVRFDLPRARSFATAFCRQCGSPMPHLTRSGREAIIPAGGFDDPLGAVPDRHVHWASRADWYVHGDGLPFQDQRPSSRLGPSAPFSAVDIAPERTPRDRADMVAVPDAAVRVLRWA